MNIIIKNYLLYSIAYDNQKNVLCRIKKRMLGFGVNYIYDAKNQLRYITKIYNTKDGVEHIDYRKYQITKVDSDQKDIVGVVDLEYMELIDGDREKEFCLRPPMINKLVLHLSENNHKLKIYLKRDGSCFIKNEKDIMLGSIKKLKRNFIIDMNIDTLDEYLLCAIYKLTRYLDRENEFVLV